MKEHGCTGRHRASTQVFHVAAQFETHAPVEVRKVFEIGHTLSVEWTMGMSSINTLSCETSEA